MNRQERCPSGVAYPVLFLVGILLLVLRNPDPIINPVVYAEDGSWVALGLREGWATALVSSRLDYFVFLNTLFLYISTQIATVTNGGLIDRLPYAIAGVSYAFYSAFALLTFVTISRVSRASFGLFAFLLVLMLPLGVTQNEIIGRILQIGFFMPSLALMLLFWRDRCGGANLRRAIDVVIVFAAGTNPVVFAVVFAYFAHVLFLTSFDLASTLKKNVLLIVLMSALAIAIFPRLGGHGAIPGDFAAGGFVEAVVARSLLFPFIFPFYTKLSNSISLGVFAIFVLSAVVAVKVSENTEAKQLTYALVICTVLYTALTILMRPGLTRMLSSYRTTFPDRYFMGINVLVSMLMVLVVFQLVSSAKARKAGIGLVVVIAFVYILGQSAILEINKSKMPIRGLLSFKEQLCLSDLVSGLYRIQIYPEHPDWNMLVPTKYVDKGKCEYRSYEQMGLARPGEEYKFSAAPSLEVNRPVPIRIVEFAAGKSVSKIELLFGTYGRVNPGNAQLVLKDSGGGGESVVFGLSTLQDNQYHAFDVPEKVYVSGEIVALTGHGVTVWESQRQDGRALACLKFKFADGTDGFTPGCPR